jgi:hypothetical protein
MAIYRMLSGMVFDPEEIKAMTSAYEAVLSELELMDRNDPLTEIIARKIITLYQTGTCEPDVLAKLTPRDIRSLVLTDRLRSLQPTTMVA